MRCCSSSWPTNANRCPHLTQSKTQIFFYHTGLCYSCNTQGTILPQGLCTCCSGCLKKKLHLDSCPFSGELFIYPPITSSAVPSSKKPSLPPKPGLDAPSGQSKPPEHFHPFLPSLVVTVQEWVCPLIGTRRLGDRAVAIWSPLCPQYYPA